MSEGWQLPKRQISLAEVIEKSRHDSSPAIDDPWSQGRVLVRARVILGEDAARVWLERENPHLGGARPVDVMRTDGPAPVLEALDAVSARCQR